MQAGDRVEVEGSLSVWEGVEGVIEDPGDVMPRRGVLLVRVTKLGPCAPTSIRIGGLYWLPVGYLQWIAQMVLEDEADG